MMRSVITASSSPNLPEEPKRENIKAKNAPFAHTTKMCASGSSLLKGDSKMPETMLSTLSHLADRFA
jgi:hypothetical protein